MNNWPNKPIKECTDEELIQVLEAISEILSERNELLRKIRTGDISGLKDEIKTVADILTAKPKT